MIPDIFYYDPRVHPSGFFQNYVSESIFLKCAIDIGQTGRKYFYAFSF